MKSKTDTKPGSEKEQSEPEVALNDGAASMSGSSHHDDEHGDEEPDFELMSPPRSSHDKDDDMDKLSAD